jgi:L-amino acid N-acyltransferase YncA
LGAGGLSDVTFRDAEVRDLPRILELTAVTWEPHRDHHPDDFNTASWAETVERLKSRFDSTTSPEYPAITLIAEADSELLGYISAIRISQRKGGDLYEHTSHIDDIFVVPQHRRKGIGRRLIARMKERLLAEGVSNVRATVWSFNSESRALFQHAGFVAEFTMVSDRLSPPNYLPPTQTAEPVPKEGKGLTKGDWALVGLATITAIVVLPQLW